MPRERLLFKNNRELRFDNRLATLKAPRSGLSLRNEAFYSWRESGINDIYLLIEGEPDGSYTPFITEAREFGLNIKRLPLERVKNEDYEFLLRLNQFLAGGLKTRSALLLYDGRNETEAISFAAMLLLTLKSTNGMGTPEGAIHYLTGRDSTLPQDEPIFRYLSSLQDSYPEIGAIKKTLEKAQGSGGELKPETSEDAIAETVAEPVHPDEAHSLPDLDDELDLAAAEITETDIDPTTDAQASDSQTIDAETIQEPAKEQKETIAPIPPVSTKNADDETKLPEFESFEPSRFLTIRNKLLFIISFIIVAALGAMIFLASSFYSDDSRVRIEEFALNTTSLIGKNIESDFRSISFTSLNLTSSLLGSGLSVPEKELLLELFYQNNERFVHLSVLRVKNGIPVVVRSSSNPKFIRESGISEDSMKQLIQGLSSEFPVALSGSPVVRNVSAGLPAPLTALLMPFNDAGQNSLVFVLLDSVKLLSSFKTRGIIKPFMVDDKGTILAHPDIKQVLSGVNLADNPAVRKMLSDKLGNGKMRYVDEDKHPQLATYYKVGFGGLGVISTVNEELAFREVANMLRRNLYILVIILFTAILIVFFFARTLSVPIRMLLGATRRIEEGDYEVEIRPTTRDEIGSLTNSFGEMAVGLLEREKLKDTFGRFVNKEIAERAARGDLSLGGEKKLCAIFFSDLRGFTAMSEKMQPEEVVHFLNEYFTGMVKCVSDTDGIVDKYIGDAVMAHWGALDSHGNDTLNAVTGALMMRQFLMHFNEVGKGKRPFARFGCGINTGYVIAGQIGSEERLEFTVIGDAVNLASRIETLNKPFGTDILISQESYNLVSDVFSVELMPSIAVKGKSEPQIIYAVLGRKDDPDCPKNMDEVRSKTGGDKPKVDLESFSDAKEEKFEVLSG